MGLWPDLILRRVLADAAAKPASKSSAGWPGALANVIQPRVSAMRMIRLSRIRWHRLGLALYVGVNVGMIVFDFPFLHAQHDWALWQAIPGGLAEGQLYDLDTRLPYVWSPVAAPLMAVMGTLGVWFSIALHVAAVLLLRDVRLIALMLASWGFWTDTVSGNTITFVVVAGVFALRGNRMAGLVYLVLLLLIPRPLQIPLAIWLLWKMPGLRWPFVGLFAVHAVAVFVSGYAIDWLQTTLAYSAGPVFNLSPAYWLGLWWLVVGLPIAAWLTLRGRVGWAGLAASTYVVPGYLLMPFAEWRAPQRDRPRAARHPD
jgi:uncharacterized membrane protein